MKAVLLFAGSVLLVGAAAAPFILAANDSAIQGVETAKVSLDAAIETAQTIGNGKAISGKYDTSSGVGRYEVVIVNGGQISTMDVNPVTGEAMKGLHNALGDSNEKGAVAIETAPVGLPDAVAMAERRAGGRAVDAALDASKEKLTYEIDIAKGDKTSTIWVDVNTGQVVKNS